MIILALALILAGSLTGTIVLWLQDAPLWQIALGYVGGGWAGLLGGMAVVMAVRGLAGLAQPHRGKPGQRTGMKRQHPAGGNAMPPCDPR